MSLFNKQNLRSVLRNLLTKWRKLFTDMYSLLVMCGEFTDVPNCCRGCVPPGARLVTGTITSVEHAPVGVIRLLSALCRPSKQRYPRIYCDCRKCWSPMLQLQAPAGEKAANWTVRKETSCCGSRKHRLNSHRRRSRSPVSIAMSTLITLFDFSTLCFTCFGLSAGLIMSQGNTPLSILTWCPSV